MKVVPFTFRDKLRLITLMLKDLPRRYRNQVLRKNQQVKYFQARGRLIEANKAVVTSVRLRCNHRKGGFWQPSDGGTCLVYPEQGDDRYYYAVIKHTFLNGDVWVTCQRCGKRWKPGDDGYDEALKFSTNNQSSGSIQFQFPDDGQYARVLMRES